MNRAMHVAALIAGVIVMAAGTGLAQETNMTGLMAHPCVLVNPEMVEGLRERAGDAEINRFGFSTAEVWQEHLELADRFLNAPPYHYSVELPTGTGQPGVPWEYALSDEEPPRHPGIN